MIVCYSVTICHYTLGIVCTVSHNPSLSEHLLEYSRSLETHVAIRERKALNWLKSIMYTLQCSREHVLHRTCPHITLYNYTYLCSVESAMYLAILLSSRVTAHIHIPLTPTHYIYTLKLACAPVGMVTT